MRCSAATDWDWPISCARISVTSAKKSCGRVLRRRKLPILLTHRCNSRLDAKREAQAPAHANLSVSMGKDRQVEQEMRAFGIVGGDGQRALKLPHHAGDHLEAQAELRLVDVEAVGKADALGGY